MNILERFFVVFGSQTEGVKKGADEAKAHVDGVAKQVDAADKKTKLLGASFLKVAESVAALGAAFLTVEFFKDGVMKSIGDNANLERLSNQLKINANDLQAWDRAAQMTGAGAGDLTGFLHGLYTQYAQLGRADLIPGILDKLKEWNRIAGTMSKDDSFRMFSQMGVPESVIRFLQLAPDQFDAIIAKQHQLGDTSEEAKQKSVEWTQEMVAFNASLSNMFTALIPGGVRVLHMLEDMATAVAALANGISALWDGKFGEYWDSLKGGKDVSFLDALAGKNKIQQIPRAAKLSGVGTKSSQVMDYFMSQGWSKDQAAGIAAQFQAESNFDPKAVGDNGHAYGIGQWHADRQKDFYRLFGHDIRESSLEQQLVFANYELTQGKEKSHGDAIRAATNPYDAGVAATGFERPANPAEYGMRGDLAAQMAMARQQINMADTTPLSSIGSSGANPLNGGSNVDISINGITINTQATDSKGIASALSDNLKSQLRGATGNWNDGIQK